ncbi:hypothetical protein WR25_08117 [Diploscapter pachys]|uniref:Membrane-associated tyrosine- and threonine-specific cdc2-inhibitory kinase wee-1.3 n=1 Tax=Diploscapter pachys TaxID=2018661 RepID=A0A2A2JKW6_9BILA|nr:hypothetical protein WR25_08117 [Diploscapter pachys]
MELCEKSLSDYANEVHPVPESDVWNFFIDLLLAVDHLHAHDLIHCDIKTENIFLTKDYVCKLGDFGLIFDSKNDKPDLAEEGDSRYLAEEVLNSYPTKASDIFSLGAIILELATDLDLPSRGDGWHQIRHGAIPNKFFEKMSTDLRRLIVNMLSCDPLARPTSFQLLVDPAVSKRLAKRKRYHTWHNFKQKIREVLVDDVYAWLVAFFHLIMVPFAWFYNTLHSTKSRIYMKTRKNNNKSSTLSRQPSSEWSLGGELHASQVPFYSADHSRRRYSLNVTPPHRKTPPPISRLCFDETESDSDGEVNGNMSMSLSSLNQKSRGKENISASASNTMRITPPPSADRGRLPLPPIAPFETPRHSPSLNAASAHRSRFVTPLQNSPIHNSVPGTPVGLGSAYRNVTLRQRIFANSPQPRPLFGNSPSASARHLGSGDFKRE